MPTGTITTKAECTSFKFPENFPFDLLLHFAIVDSSRQRPTWDLETAAEGEFDLQLC